MNKNKLTLNRIVIIGDYIILPIAYIFIGGLVFYKIMEKLLITPEFLEIVTKIQQLNQPEATSYIAIRLTIILLLGFIVPFATSKLIPIIFDRKEMVAKFKEKWNLQS